MTKKQIKKTVMIIDDDEMISEVLGIILVDFGYEIVSVNNPTEAYKKALSVKPNLILLDLIMPQMDGTEILSKLKNNPETSSIPIILISASHKIEEAAKKHNASGFLEKPFGVDDLHDIVNKHLEPQ